MAKAADFTGVILDALLKPVPEMTEATKKAIIALIELAYSAGYDSGWEDATD